MLPMSCLCDSRKCLVIASYLLLFSPTTQIPRSGRGNRSTIPKIRCRGVAAYFLPCEY